MLKLLLPLPTSLKSIGCKVLVDLGYFKFPYREAEIGKPQVTHWDWKLDYYGIDKSNLDWINLNNLRSFTKDSKKDIKEGIEIFNLHDSLKNFEELTGNKFKDYSIKNNNVDNLNDFFIENPVIIHDGPNKSKLFINAMETKNIKRKFQTKSKEWKNIIDKNNINFDNTVVLHLRRGDYLNVATHLISCEEVLKTCQKLKKSLKILLFFQNSKKCDNESFIIELKKIFLNVKWMDEIDNVNTHKIMTQANFLLCSNSQFSTTAAYLGEGFSIIPQKYSSDSDYIFQYENNQTSFALLNN